MQHTELWTGLSENGHFVQKTMSNPGMLSTELPSPFWELKSLTTTGYLIGLVVTPLLPLSGCAELDKWKSRAFIKF